MALSSTCARHGVVLPVTPAAPRPPASRLGPFAAIRALRNNPITFFAEEAYRAPYVEFARARVVLINDPDAIEHVLVQNSGNYRKSRQQRHRLRPVLGDGLLTAEGETWRSTRRMFAPLFSHAAIPAYFDDIHLATKAMLARWGERDGATVDVCTEFQRLTFEVISRTVFSGALDEDRVHIHQHMADYLDTIGRIDLAALLGLPSWWPQFDPWRGHRSLTALRLAVDRVIRQRRHDDGREDVDLLDRLMYASDPLNGRVLPANALPDNVLTFLAAGHETTSNALAWIVYLLALSPDAECNVLQELRDVFPGEKPTKDGLDRLDFTRAVLNEALRLYPPAPFIGREAIDDDRLCSRPVRKGTQVLISPWIVHRHRTLWSDPDTFRPSRFLSTENKGRPRGAFIPFGLGPRICIGQGFAIQEILTILATMLPRFKFNLDCPELVCPQAGITLRPGNGIRMTLQRR